MFLSANNTGLNAAANAVNSGKTINAPAGIKTTTQAAQEALTAKSDTSSGMGQKDFLTLFTTQLKCQDPLDPVKNEAFVAQLAQFSQLEATTGMADTLKAYVDSMAGERMMSSTSMIGKTVAAPGAPAIISQGGRPAQGFVSLPTGAEGVKLEVFNDKGQLVTSQVMGAQSIGDMPFYWDGTSSTGNKVPDGAYTFKASVTSQGKTTTPVVNVLSTVTGVNQQADKTILLEVAGGKSVKLIDVQRIGS
ncbi:flagellar hook assembly protein FlgD [Limnohabitans sp. Rim11]|jgi:flagellar basal-body rod modification protein FlgD|uniref:flagellar hook assembly protein FlgD n=1 Tax=Limnohabitans sp. Rim11 TaxID=1100719 RepID=UPI000A6ED81F|nr:flagellar hook capping FlgD N-terminal domain-containing protein [Limnohabitans sp. Rim11]